MGKSTFGNVRRRASGRWQARYFLDGAWHNAPNTFTTKADANAWLAREQADRSRGAWVDPKSGKETLEAYATRWLDGRSDLRETTRAKYGDLLRRHILPALGRKELAHLEPADIRAWYHRLARDHQATADDCYRLLRAVVNTAVADGHLAKSPCTVKGAGSVRAEERPVASVVEVARVADEMPDRLRVAVLLAAWCQMRRGEMLALQRRHVDLLHGTVRIEQAWVVPPGGRPVIGPPKTEAGRRTVAIPPNILLAVEEHLQRFVGPEPKAWLFGTSTGAAISPAELPALLGQSPRRDRPAGLAPPRPEAYRAHLGGGHWR